MVEDGAGDFFPSSPNVFQDVRHVGVFEDVGADGDREEGVVAPAGQEEGRVEGDSRGSPGGANG